ncbi:MAG: hypothetical protein HUU57_04735 [Bdellovibrio sp.]|nr:hypothetical protein [Bdellovibrio sp.]
MGKKGQSVILFCLILSAVIVILLGSIMISLQSFNKGVTRLKTRILGYQATVQISQIIQQGFTTAVKYPTCVVPPTSNLVPIMVAGKLLCLPADEICINNQFRYCVAKSSGYLISKHTPHESEDIFAQTKSPFHFDFSFLPMAYAQTKPKVWLPVLSSVPTASIQEAGFDPNKATVCEPAASANANCFKVRICTNGSDSCSNSKDYFEALVAIVTVKI